MKNGMVVASAVLGLFGTMGCSADDGETSSKGQEIVQCEGINECKGTSECASADGSSSCAGMNDCAGMGWISVSRDKCEEEGGMVVEAEAKT